MTDDAVAVAPAHIKWIVRPQRSRGGPSYWANEKNGVSQPKWILMWMSRSDCMSQTRREKSEWCVLG